MDEDAHPTPVLSTDMERPAPLTPRVVLAVTPRLLADSLAATFRGVGVDVEIVEPGFDEHVDLAVVTADVPSLDADMVLQLESGTGSTAAATVRGPSGGPLLQLDGLSTIVDFVRRWCTDPVQRSRSSR